MKILFLFSICTCIAFQVLAGTHSKKIIKGRLVSVARDTIVVQDQMKRKWVVPKRLLKPYYPLNTGDTIQVAVESNDVKLAASHNRAPASK